jgi:hypothetical protein
MYVMFAPLLLDLMDMIILLGSEYPRSWIQGCKDTSFGPACKWAKIDCSERVQCVLPGSTSLLSWIWDDCSHATTPNLWEKTGWFFFFFSCYFWTKTIYLSSQLVYLYWFVILLWFFWQHRSRFSRECHLFLKMSDRCFQLLIRWIMNWLSYIFLLVKKIGCVTISTEIWTIIRFVSYIFFFWNSIAIVTIF